MHLWRFLMILLLGISCSSNVSGQQYDPGILTTVDALFDGMRTADSSKVRGTFAPGSYLISIPENPTDSVALKKNTVDGFVQAVGKPHKLVWDEQIYKVKISVDGPMAIVWAPYKFFLGETFSHCGVNVFTLIRVGNEWKIMSITDTRRKDRCL